MPFEPEILEKRIVASASDGSEMAWLLQTREDNSTEWAPRVTYPGGRTERPVWLPLPGSQYTFLECPVFEALYEGTRGPGKTLTLIMDFAKDVGKGYGKAWRGIMFRQKLGDLDDVVRKIEEWMYQLYPGFRFRKSKADYSAVWPTGEELLLRHMEDERNYGEYHGHEYPWIGWEELTQWPNDKAYKLMMSCSRPTRPGIKTRIRSTTNPYGPGHNWVKRRFMLPTMRGRVVRKPGEKPRVAIHGNLSENILLLHQDPGYPMIIREAATNPAQAEAWLAGSWDVTSGGMIDDLFDNDVHILPKITPDMIPRGWTITRSYDHGQSSPFACGWFLESNGEPIDVGGRLIGNIRGDIILWNEWYGTTGQDNTGVRLPAIKIGAGIKDREDDLGIHRRVVPGPADTEIFNKATDRDGRCPADDMEDEGIVWERADKSSGSRKRGWEMLRTYLSNAIPGPDGTRERPGFFVCENCSWWIELCKPMPRDEKDLDEVPSTYEDHLADMTRYRLNWEVPGMFRMGF
ncbi:MAG: terminase large subunit domain-containing protein [Candidatus Thorarchaeota archaeon]|jgi:hypothetical protein